MADDDSISERLMVVYDQEFQKLASQHALPPLPDGRRLTIGLGSLADCDSGGRVWSSAAVLCRWLASNKELVRGRSVLELGCGTGAVGLHAAALGAHRVTLTDGGSDALLALAASNVRANSALLGGTDAVCVVPHPWGALAEGRAFCGHDWILGSDVTYAIRAHDDLCRSIAAQLCVHSPGAQVIIAHQYRHEPGDEPDERLDGFVAAAAANGMHVTTVLSETDQGGRRVCLLRVQEEGPAPTLE